MKVMAMGHNTIYLGSFKLDKQLSEKQAREIFDLEISSDVMSGYCQWTPTGDRRGIEWNRAEKFYYGMKWLKVVIERFVEPWGLVLNGACPWYDDFDQAGILAVKNNVVSNLEMPIEEIQEKFGTFEIYSSRVSNEEWKKKKNHFRIGETVSCHVDRNRPYVIFDSIENESSIRLVQRARITQNGQNTPIDYPVVGSRVSVTILGFRDDCQEVELELL